VLVLTWVGIIVPYRTCFFVDTTHQSAWFWLDVLIDIYFIGAAPPRKENQESVHNVMLSSAASFISPSRGG
jgi:hypothetical protein